MSSDMTEKETIIFYYEKQHAIQQGDIAKLRELKKQCPVIFDKKNELLIRSTIEFAKQFMSSSSYQKMRQINIKNNMKLIKNNSHDE